MNKTELVDAIATEAELTKVDAARALNACIKHVTQSLQNGEEVALIGFGTFGVSERPARIGRNPNNGQEIQIRASRVPKFKAGKSLKDAVNIEATAN